MYIHAYIFWHCQQSGYYYLFCVLGGMRAWTFYMVSWLFWHKGKFDFARDADRLLIRSHSSGIGLKGYYWQALLFMKIVLPFKCSDEQFWSKRQGNNCLLFNQKKNLYLLKQIKITENLDLDSKIIMLGRWTRTHEYGKWDLVETSW